MPMEEYIPRYYLKELKKCLLGKKNFWRKNAEKYTLYKMQASPLTLWNLFEFKVRQLYSS